MKLVSMVDWQLTECKLLDCVSDWLIDYMTRKECGGQWTSNHDVCHVICRRQRRTGCDEASADDYNRDVWQDCVRLLNNWRSFRNGVNIVANQSTLRPTHPSLIFVVLAPTHRNHNRDLQISKAPLESQSLGTSLFTSTSRLSKHFAAVRNIFCYGATCPSLCVDLCLDLILVAATKVSNLWYTVLHRFCIFVNLFLIAIVNSHKPKIYTSPRKAKLWEPEYSQAQSKTHKNLSITSAMHFWLKYL